MTTILTRITLDRWPWSRSKASALQIRTPHVPLRQARELSTSQLQDAGCQLVGEEGDAQLFASPGDDFVVTIHAADGFVTSVVYDDPAGREDKAGKAQRTRLYLVRYGAYSNWTMQMRNDWMEYWFNPVDKVAMVYGIDMDVLRFNCHDGE